MHVSVEAVCRSIAEKALTPALTRHPSPVAMGEEIEVRAFSGSIVVQGYT
jgi:hypothetical protein